MKSISPAAAAAKKMNRAFLIILVPALLVAAAYVVVAAKINARLSPGPFLGAVGGFVAAVGIVYWYRRRKDRRR